MKKYLAVLLACLLLAACGKTPDKPVGEIAGEVDPINDNYRTFYEIFVYSFCDSDGNGIGDLKGVISKLVSSPPKSITKAPSVDVVSSE